MRVTLRSIPWFAAMTFALSAAAQSSTAPASTTPAQQSPADALPDAPSAMVHEAPAAVPTGSIVVFDTSMGRMVCRLFDKEAPITSANFVGLATGTKEFTDPVTSKKVTGVPFYDGTTFHRVIPGFMIQGGDRVGNGTGDAGYYIEDEILPSLRFDVPGRLAMANSGPNTNSAQFFITEAPQPDLTGHYSIFGQCDEHAVVMVMSIARVQRGADDKPVTPVMLNKVTVLKPGQPLPPDPHPAPAASPTPAAPPPQNQ
ncbi:peptidyl-prolyl cis-trans isomerase A (cyclophilin A) [Bryocella elongata]|uniref:Peptidyl-prolyl cis-trans isomerase n=2 Tax=Bryocella elongata TaxID=863522 RepID=A0A1H5SGE5_9BACT|nr:peptidyl-prolyl cis-trans isomerase A (cyclophilin A) [Bryocella elongata]